MIFEDVKNNMIKAMKEHNTADKGTYSLFLARLKNKAIELHKSTLEDSESIMEAKKFVKVLAEELEYNKKAGKDTTVAELARSIDLIQEYIPEQLSEEKIIEIITENKLVSVKDIMTFFKTNFNGTVDLGLVNRVARSLT